MRVSYRLGSVPEVEVLQPRLQGLSNGSPIPHVYPGNRPCVYLPRSGEWNPSMFIGDTIVPWVALWLYYYEMWHATGQWLGGGVHSDDKEEVSEQ